MDCSLSLSPFLFLSHFFFFLFPSIFFLCSSVRLSTYLCDCLFVCLSFTLSFSLCLPSYNLYINLSSHIFFLHQMLHNNTFIAHILDDKQYKKRENSLHYLRNILKKKKYILEQNNGGSGKYMEPEVRIKRNKWKFISRRRRGFKKLFL